MAAVQTIANAAIGRPADALPEIRTITTAAVGASLREGYEDFLANPTHYIFMGLMVPVIGAVLIMLFSGVNLLPLVFPAITGLALIAPIAAVGIYQISKRREQGLESNWENVVEVVRPRASGALLQMGALLWVVFAAWLGVAYAIYGGVVGPYAPLSAMTFLHDVVTTPAGWALIVIGNAVGFLFAAFVLAISVVAFPLIVDRQVNVATAVRTSVAATRRNPVPVALWGLAVAVILLLGAIPLLVGLAVAVPLLGHATWHFYRKLVV
jgi:uncharacterized membrane protein